MSSKPRRWLSDRFGLGTIYRAVLDRRVAESPWYFGDGASLALLFLVLVVTGALMTLSYAPTPEAAYLSVRHITDRQLLGWLVRGLHYWSAGLMVVMLVVHVLRQVVHGGYKAPREGTWLVGVPIFFTVVAMSLIGYVLRWDERALHAIQVVLHGLHRVPVIGDELVVLVQGGVEPGGLTLTRLYSLHTVILPLLLVGLVGYHQYLVVLHGVTSPRERVQPVGSGREQKELYKAQAESEEHGEHFYPDTVADSGTMGLAVLAVAAALALALGPAPLYPPVGQAGPSFPVEEWWFWWYSALIALLPPSVAPWFVVAFPVALFVGMVLLPFVDRGPARGSRNRPFAVAFAALVVVGLVGLSALRLRSPWTAWTEPEPPPVPEGIVLSPAADEGRRLFARLGCTSCHPVSGQGRQVAVDLARTERRWSRSDYRQFILDPPEDVPMPAYRGRVTETELERLLDFVHAAQTFPREQAAR